MLKRLILLLLSVGAVSASAQSDPEGGFVLLGWSKKGHVAMRSYHENFGISHSCSFVAKVVNLVTDEVVWQHKLDWDEGNSGESDAPVCPTAKGAWRSERATIEAALKRFEIPLAESTEVKPFPYVTESDSVSVAVVAVGEKYEVRATSKARGTKVVSTGEVFEGDTPSISGWVAGPDKNRIAIVLQPVCMEQHPCPPPVLLGCHLRAGFSQTR